MSAFEREVKEDAPAVWHRFDEEDDAQVLVDHSPNGHDGAYTAVDAMRALLTYQVPGPVTGDGSAGVDFPPWLYPTDHTVQYPVRMADSVFARGTTTADGIDPPGFYAIWDDYAAEIGVPVREFTLEYVFAAGGLDMKFGLVDMLKALSDDDPRFLHFPDHAWDAPSQNPDRIHHAGLAVCVAQNGIGVYGYGHNYGFDKWQWEANLGTDPHHMILQVRNDVVMGVGGLYTDVWLDGEIASASHPLAAGGALRENWLTRPTGAGDNEIKKLVQVSAKLASNPLDTEYDGTGFGGRLFEFAAYPTALSEERITCHYQAYSEGLGCSGIFLGNWELIREIEARRASDQVYVPVSLVPPGEEDTRLPPRAILTGRELIPIEEATDWAGVYDQVRVRGIQVPTDDVLEGDAAGLNVEINNLLCQALEHEAAAFVAAKAELYRTAGLHRQERRRLEFQMMRLVRRQAREERDRYGRGHG